MNRILLSPLLWGALPLCAAPPPASLRVATFNCSLNRTDQGSVISTLLANPNASAPKRVAEIIQRVRPDVLLLNEFDYDAAAPSTGPSNFQTNFLSVSQGGQPTIEYPYIYTGPVNTGIHSGLDLDNSTTITTTPGTESYGNDCWGFGRWPGQYGMVVYSKYPLLSAGRRTFQNFLWRLMPNPNWPDDASTPTIQADFYNNAEKNAFRLSSKSHWDLPIDLGNGHLFRFLTSHPTPPSFDGAEDRNGRRNHDEIRFWADYITPGQAGHIKDDASALGGIAPQSRFVIAGDLNADPQDGDSFQRAARLLTQHPLLQTSFVPTSNGGPAAAASQGGANNAHTGPAAQDTADFSDAAPGNLRVDYVLPSQTGWRVLGGGVFWPTTSEPGAALVGVSDHRLVWMDLAPIPQLELAIAQLRAATENGQLILRWISAAGYTYAVESATWLSGPWQKEMSMVPTISGSAAQAVDSAPSPGKKFYRLRIGFAL